MPLNIYSQQGNHPNYRPASALYEEGMAIADTDKTTALKKLRQALRLFENCHDTVNAGLVREEITRLGG